MRFVTATTLACAMGLMLGALLTTPTMKAAPVDALQGTIVAVNDGEVMFRDEGENVRMLNLSSGCEVTINGEAANVKLLAPGMVATLTVGEQNQCVRIDAMKRE